MPLTLGAHRPAAEAAALERLRDFFGDPAQVTPIFGAEADPATATLVAPHAGYVVDGDRLLDGAFLDAARRYALRYLLAVEPERVGVAELLPKKKSPSILRLGRGEADSALLAALKEAREALANVEEEVEPRFLLIPELHFAALWLHGPSEQVVPLLPEPEGLTAGKTYDADEIAPLLRRLAESNQPRPTRRRTVTASEPPAAELPYLSQANYLGQGFDITGTYELPESLILPVVDANKASWKTFEFQGTKYSIPSFATAAIDTRGRYTEKVAATREELQNSIAVTAKVAAGYGAFSGEMDASYGQDLTSSSEYDYGYYNYYARLGVLTMDLNVARTMLMKDFVERYEELPAEVNGDTLEEFELFFHDYGMYVTSMVALGGSLEYSVAVNKKSESSLTSIEANLKAEYKGVLFSGELSGSLTSTDSWKRYRENRKGELALRGGDPTLISELAGVDVNTPKAKTVATYNQWLESLKSAPAVADFSLIGIWELIPDAKKRKLVSDAFTALQVTMRPRLTVETNWQAGWPPTITLGRSIRPEDPPEKPSGYQMVMIERSTLRRIAIDKYYTVERDAKHDKYASIYDQIADDIQEGGFDHPGMLMVLASFGVSFAAPPTSRLVPLLRSFGAGDELSLWIQKATPGLNMDFRCSYVLVGIGGVGPRSGVEMLRLVRQREIDELEVFFYQQRGVNTYSLSLGKRSEDEPKRGEEDAPERRSFFVSGPDHAYVEDADE